MTKYRDRTQLSKRESEILALQKQGMTYNQIAETLNISFGTVCTRMKSIHQRMVGKMYKDDQFSSSPTVHLQ